MPIVIQGLTQFLGADGKIDEGKLIRYYRKKVRGWKNAQILVDLYNELLGENVSARWLQRMEQQNKVPVDQKRRWILATLLSIPPAYLGLSALQPIIQLQDKIQIIPATKYPHVDIEEYGTRLKVLWRSNQANAKDPEIIPEVVARIYTLQDVLLYGKKEQRDQIAVLLCKYLLLCGNIHRYQGYFSTACAYFKHALTLAKEKDYYELFTEARYLRGFTFFNKWTLWQDAGDRADLVSALRDMNAAQELIASARKRNRFISQSLRSAILADGGRTQAYLAQDNQDRLRAINQIDQGGRIVSASGFQNHEDFLRIDEDWYYIDKAEAFIACGWPKAALNELENVQRGDAALHQRYLYTYILEGEANIARGWIEVGIAYLEDALQCLNETTSRRHLNHIARTYNQLSSDEKSCNSPDVARLGVRLLMVQHPELFH
jgi:tetratricopeptide (TPR) repeat protein